MTITARMLGAFRSIPEFWTAFLAFVRARAVPTTGGWRVSMNQAPSAISTVINRISIALTGAAAADLLIPNSFGPILGLGGGDLLSPAPITSETQAHPASVVKQWTANGVQMVRLSDGRMGAFSKKRNAWKYWRPKRPIVLYSGGSSNLNTLLKADRAAERQLRKLKKVMDRRFPRRQRTSRPSSSSGQTIIQETGPGGVQRT